MLAERPAYLAQHLDEVEQLIVVGLECRCGAYLLAHRLVVDGYVDRGDVEPAGPVEELGVLLGVGHVGGVEVGVVDAPALGAAHLGRFAPAGLITECCSRV